MILYINAKQIQKRREAVAAFPYECPRSPETLRQLLVMLVRDGVRSHNLRRQQTVDARPLSGDEVEAMAQVGKIAFGIPFGTREADPDAAVDAAIQGFRDGLFRVFAADREIESLDAPLMLHEGDPITIIRLVMLTGGYF